MPALAPILADRFGDGTGVGAWPVEGGHWVIVAVRDGLLLPEGDLLCPDEQTARQRICDYLDDRSQDGQALGNPDILLLPPTWLVERASDNGSLADAIGKGKGERLSAIAAESSGASAKLATAIFLVAVTSAVLGILWASGLWDVTETPNIVLPTKVTKTQEAPPPPPWWDTVPPGALAPLCPAALNRLPVLPGYGFVRLSCSGGNVSLLYARNPYASLLVLDQINVAGRLSLPDKDSARIDRPVQLVREGRQGEQPLSADRIMRQVHGVGQFFELGTELTEVTPPAPPPGADAPPPPPYRTFRFQITGKAADPRLVLPRIAAPTLTLEAVQYDDRGWRLQGNIYAHR
jgi:hypothetical protein